jgi:hypothetical protein
MVKMIIERVLGQFTKLRFWIFVAAAALIVVHPEWIMGMFREDMTMWDIVMGIVGVGAILAGLYIAMIGLLDKDWLILAIGLAVVAGGVSVLWVIVR